MTDMRQFLVGGRGYGKNAAAAEAARRRFLDSLPIGKPRTFAPGIGMVVWGCRRPTEAAYNPGQAGWWQEQASAYQRGEIDALDLMTAAKEAAKSWVI